MPWVGEGGWGGNGIGIGHVEANIQLAT